MRKLVPLFLPFILAACTVAPVAPPESVALPDETAATMIQSAKVANAISGTLSLPANVREMSQEYGGRPPVYLHAFRTTGELLRDARIALFWKDDRSIAFVVDKVPEEVPTLLVATVEPGIVLRAIIPPASTSKPAWQQQINPRSEVIVQELIKQGVIPPVAPAGIGSVLAQGGLDPIASSDLYERAKGAPRMGARFYLSTGLLVGFRQSDEEWYAPF